MDTDPTYPSGSPSCCPSPSSPPTSSGAATASRR